MLVTDEIFHCNWEITIEALRFLQHCLFSSALTLLLFLKNQIALWIICHHCICCILILDRAVNQRFLWIGRTCESSHVVDRKSLALWNDICKCLREAVGWVGVSWSQWGTESDPAYSHWEHAAGGRRLSRGGLRLSTPGQEPEVLSWALKITQRGMVKRRSYGSI